MTVRTTIIGIDEPHLSMLRSQVPGPVTMHESLPRIIVRDGELLVRSPTGFMMEPVSQVVFHGIFEEDHDLIAALALWGGPCLPSATAMMDCRMKLPCLVRALRYTEFGSPPRGYSSPNTTFETTTECVAKWGNWHCGENKLRFTESYLSDESTIIEPFLEGEAIRVVVIGDDAWQIQLQGDDWLKSIHHPTAAITSPDPRLVRDTQQVAAGLGLEIAANDYIVTPDGVPHLLEVNHIPNVTRFPEIWEAYSRYVVAWLQGLRIRRM